MIEMVKSITQKARSFNYDNYNYIDINKVIKDFIELKKIDTKLNKDIKLKIKLAENLPLLKGKKVDFKQIFSNLINNSMHALNNENNKNIIIETDYDNKYIYIFIKDTGQGIKQKNINKIFSSDFTTKKPGKRTDLGLFITKQMVESHKGKIEVKSKWNKGTEFILKIPYQD